MDDGIQVGSSRQATALARKALSYQKRQMFTNCCCILACPFLMVFLAGFLGNLIVGLIQKANPINEFIYCSAVAAMNEVHIPLWNGTDPLLPTSSAKDIPGTTLDTVTHVNWALVTGALSLSGPPGAAAFQFKRPCVKWYGESYPFSKVYERDPGVKGIFVRDSANLAQPLGGWLNVLGNASLADAFTVNVFQVQQLRAASLYGAASEVDLALIGKKEKSSFLPPQVLFNASFANLPPFSPATNESGLFGTIPSKYYAIYGVNNKTLGPLLFGVEPSPWFNYTKGNDEALDDALGLALSGIILEIAKIPKDGLTGNNRTAANLVFIQVGKVLQNLPYGGVFFNQIDHKKKKYSYNLHYGSDIRVSGASNFPAPGQRLLYEQTQLSNAILRHSNTNFSQAQITQGLRIFPYVANTKFTLPFGGLIGGILYPFGVSFLLPIFTIILFQEKENRILVMMRMNGMKSWAYYLSHYGNHLLTQP
jgi:hypothetical protein